MTCSSFRYVTYTMHLHTVISNYGLELDATVSIALFTLSPKTVVIMKVIREFLIGFLA